jgi:hypothetical protein
VGVPERINLLDPAYWLWRSAGNRESIGAKVPAVAIMVADLPRD